uniref:Uncharacterized protein n=1 Tax=Zea mays TaxID=4577 RepID=B6T1B4_MAIZE|nr:hypothetical protein [Zea mays]
MAADRVPPHLLQPAALLVLPSCDVELALDDRPCPSSLICVQGFPSHGAWSSSLDSMPSAPAELVLAPASSLDGGALPFLQQAGVPLSIIFSAWFLASSPCSSARPGPVPFFHSCGKHQPLPTPTSLSYGRCPSLVSGGRPPLLLPW